MPFDSKLPKQFHKHDKLYGTTTLGARGQLVIPAQARKDLNLKPGDQIVVLGRFGKVLALLKTDQLSQFIDAVLRHVEGSGMEKQIKERLSKTFGKIIKNK